MPKTFNFHNPALVFLQKNQFTPCLRTVNCHPTFIVPNNLTADKIDMWG